MFCLEATLKKKEEKGKKKFLFSFLFLEREVSIFKGKDTTVKGGFEAYIM